MSIVIPGDFKTEVFIGQMFFLFYAQPLGIKSLKAHIEIKQHKGFFSKSNLLYFFCILIVIIIVNRHAKRHIYISDVILYEISLCDFLSYVLSAYLNYFFGRKCFTATIWY